MAVCKGDKLCVSYQGWKSWKAILELGGGAGNQQAESGEYDQEACSFKTGFKGRLQPQVKLGEKDDEHIEIGKTLNTA